MYQVALQSHGDTAALARRVASLLTGGETIGLSGDLGAGKTTFVRYLAAALGISVEVSSPTYVLQHEYLSSHGLSLEHWDLYRLGAPPLELMESPAKNIVRVVEWIERDSTNAPDLRIVFSVTGDGRTADLSGRLATGLN